MSKVPRFFQVEPGVPWYEQQGIAWEECCDCGLIHKVKYVVHDVNGKIIKGAKVQLTSWRHEGYTEKKRRQRRKNGTLKLESRE